MAALHDVWVIGDKFLSTLEGALADLQQISVKDKSTPSLYLQDYFNIKVFNKFNKSDAKHAIGRTLNALIEAVNGKNASLPKYLLVLMDKDVIEDVDDIFDFEASKIVATLTQWLVKQVHTVIRRKKVDLLDKKPGTLYDFSTKIIFVRMLHRIGSFHNKSRIAGVLALHPKFNDSLNDAVAKIGHYMLTVNACNAYEHYDKHGLLSAKGKEEFWLEIDDLLEHFDFHKVKLLPNPKNPPKKSRGYSSTPRGYYHGSHGREHQHAFNQVNYSEHWQDGSCRRKLPTPPPN